jgi:hypothetical protein
MADKNEMVVVKLSAENRRKLWCQYNDCFSKLGYVRIPDEFHKYIPDLNGEVTLAQLVVLAAKLKARIVISNLNIKKT